MQTRLNLLRWTTVARAFSTRFPLNMSVPMFLRFSRPGGQSLGAVEEQTPESDQVAPFMSRWEPLIIFLLSFALFAFLTPRITTYLDPTTGDEPFYLMTVISIAHDFDLNECNNYRQRNEAAIYPAFYTSANG